MTKTPKEIRDRRGVDRRIGIINNGNHCFCCKQKDDSLFKCFSHKNEFNNDVFIFLCYACSGDFCQICLKNKPFITVRRDYYAAGYGIKQICSDCYLKLCMDIVKIDNEYGIDDISESKLTDGE